MSYLDIIRKYSSAVKFMEIAAFLHDADKADLQFKQNPEFHTKASLTEKQERWNRYFDGFDPAMPDCGIQQEQLEPDKEYIITTGNGKLSAPFCYHHINEPETKGTLLEFPIAAAVVHGGIGGADGLDSGLDKASGSNSRKQQEPFFIASPFQKQLRYWDNFEFHETTRKLLQRNAPIREYREHFSNILGETRIPFNDVTLWDHAFNVASFAKSIFAKILVEYHSGLRQNGMLYTFPHRTGVKYLKVEIDRDSLMSQGHVVADLYGADEACKLIMNALRDMYETELCLGNETYADESRQLFTFPDLADEYKVEFEKEIISRLEQFMGELLIKFDLQQLPFVITIGNDNTSNTKKKTENRLLLQAADLLKSNEKHAHSHAALKQIANSIALGRVCDVCRIRNAQKGHDNDDHLCPVCFDRRKKYEADSVENLLPHDENKLAFFSIDLNLNGLRDGSLFEAQPALINKENAANKNKNDPEKPLASPARIYRSHETIKNFLQDFLNSLEMNKLKITVSPETLKFIIPAKFIDKVLEAFAAQRFEVFGNFAIPVKISTIAFYKTFPLYAVIDAASEMKKYLNDDSFDCMLLDTVGDRYIFTEHGRRHHIFGDAKRYSLAQIGDFVKVWNYIGRLEKSQISNIENALIAKILDWKDTGSEAFRAFCKMTLFAPNALGKMDCQGNEQFLIDAAVSGLMLDVIDLYIHIENKK